MTPESVMMMGTEAMKVALALAAPLLLVALVTGLIISILQAATQINEMTLSFIPKIIAVFIAIIIAGPWMLNLLLDYVRTLFTNLPYMKGCICMMRIRPASGERSVKDRKAGVKGWTIFSPPVKRYRSRIPDCARPV